MAMKPSSYENMKELKQAILLLVKEYDPKDQATACVAAAAHIADKFGFDRRIFARGIETCPPSTVFDAETAPMYDGGGVGPFVVLDEPCCGFHDTGGDIGLACDEEEKPS